MNVLDLETFRATPLSRDPYEHMVIPGFVKADALREINADYPKIEHAGSFPRRERVASALAIAPRLRRDLLRSRQVELVVEELELAAPERRAATSAAVAAAVEDFCATRSHPSHYLQAKQPRIRVRPHRQAATLPVPSRADLQDGER